MPRLYTETNLVLELVYLQEHAPAVEHLLTLAAAGGCELAVPAFSLGEAHNEVVSEGQRYNTIREQVRYAANEMRRSARFAAQVSDVQAFLASLNTWKQVHLSSLADVLTRLASTAVVLNTTTAALQRAARLHADTGLEHFADAVVLATVLDDLRDRPADQTALVSTDTAFGAEAVKSLLRPLGCRYIGRFDQAVQFAEGGA